MEFRMDALRARTSTRSYSGQALTAEEAAALSAAFGEALPAPFGGRPRFVLLAAAEAGLAGAASGRIGTYGLIKNPPAFVLGAVSRGEGAFEDFGYALEAVVLRATELGLGSCWIGGLFDRGAAGRALGLQSQELLPAVLALGRPAERMSLPERLTRLGARAGTRKPFGELFFDEAFNRSLDPSAAGPWAAILEAVRIGPSASNKQPWRILRQAPTGRLAFHLYLEEDWAYNHALGEVRIQNIDMGIAMRHFEAAAQAAGLPGSWSRLSAAPMEAPAPKSYIASWLTA